MNDPGTDDLRAGEDKEGNNMEQITIREIARLCGVGVSTVSRAINNHPDINEETKTKILETIRAYNYVPNNSARNLKRSESSTSALLVKGISNPFVGGMLGTLEREIEKYRYSFVLEHVEDHEDEIETAIRLEKEKRLKGVIFLGGMLRHSRESYERLTLPFVVATVHMQLPETVKNGAVVSMDDEAESMRLVDRLCQMGHRRIAMLTAAREDQSIGFSRLQGYRRALEEHGIAYDENLVVYSRKDDSYTMQNGYAMMQELLEREVPFTCVYGASDTLAVGACKAIFDAGKNVPGDYSVAGFDGLDIAQFYQPDIMTVCQPREQMAVEAVEILLALIRGRKVRQKVVFEGSIREGKSVKII